MTPRSATFPLKPAPGLEPVDDVAVISRRLERFDLTRDPSVLWPGLAEPARVAAARELERVTRAVLAGAGGVPIDPGSFHGAYALAVAGHTTGMGPVIGRWAEDGLVIASGDVRRAFARHLEHGRRRAARMEREVLPALDALIARDITPAVLKGFHTGRVYFDEPGARRMLDIDLLIPANRISDTEAALRDVGFRPDTAAERPYKRDWVGPGVDPRVFSIELADERSKWVLELHASLDRRYHPGAIALFDAERGRVEPFNVAGRRLLGLSPSVLLLTIAGHCSQELDGTRLLRLFEIVRVIRVEREAGRLDWDDVLATLRRTGAARFTYPALALAEALAPGTVDARVIALGQRESTWAARHTVARLAPAGGSLDERGVLRQLMWARGPVSVLDRLWRTAWPKSGWGPRLRRLRSRALSLHAPDEREP